MDLTNPPEKYWHCKVKVVGDKKATIVNDLTFSELKKSMVDPWNNGQPFSIGGVIVRSPDNVTEIQIVWTSESQRTFAQRHNESTSARGIADFATDRKALPFSRGEDVTFALLFSAGSKDKPGSEVSLVELVCRRLPYTAKILANRSRKGKSPYEIVDEYDVQDLLHAVLRAHIKYSVQEDPLPKVAASKSSRADISVEELGIIIEIKFVYGPDDQKRIFEDYSQDLVLYASWPHLKKLIYLIYNSGDLRDPEAFDKLSGQHEVNGKRFEVLVVLA